MNFDLWKKDEVDDDIRLSLLDLLQDLIPSININDQSRAQCVLYYFEFFFSNVWLEEASSFIGNKGLSKRDDALVRQSLMIDHLNSAYWDQKLKLISNCNTQRETAPEGSRHRG